VSGIASAAEPRALEPVSMIPLPGVKGRIDHLAFDRDRQRLFVAALGNDTVEVIDVAGNRVEKSLPGFGEPQGVAYTTATNSIYVANGSANRVDVLDAGSLQLKKKINSLDDADNVRYDERARQIYVGYGRGALRVLNIDTADSAANIQLAGHPESFQLEHSGSRIFVNVPSARHVAVVDRVKGSVIANWPTSDAGSNFPMALDEGTHRLFVGARKPPVVLIYDTASGAVVGKLPIGEDTDDLFFDSQRQRLYVICGEGRVDVFQQEAAGRYMPIASIKTAPRARTGLWVSEQSRLYVAAPEVAGTAARVLVFQAR